MLGVGEVDLHTGDDSTAELLQVARLTLRLAAPHGGVDVDGGVRGRGVFPQGRGEGGEQLAEGGLHPRFDAEAGEALWAGDEEQRLRFGGGQPRQIEAVPSEQRPPAAG